MKINEILTLIENKKVTTDDFNRFISESLPRTAQERVNRRSRVTKQNERTENPVTKARTITRTGNTDPTKTSRGKKAIAKRGRINKQRASQFKEAIDFINANKNKPIAECLTAFEKVGDKKHLNAIVKRLLADPNNHISSDWLYSIHRTIENGR